MGGTGRTGTVVIGAVHNLGFRHPVIHSRMHGKSSYLEIAGQEDFLEAHHKVITAEMMRQCPTLCYKIVFDQLNELCGHEDENGKLKVINAVGLRSKEEKQVLRTIFNWIDSNAQGRGKTPDGILSISQFISSFRELVQKYDINPDAFTDLSNERLRALFGFLEPKVLDIPFTSDSVTFELFARAMELRPRLNSEKKMGKVASYAT